MNFKFTKGDLILLLVFFAFAIPVALHGYDYTKGWGEPIIDVSIYIVSTCIALYFIVYVMFPYFFPRKRIVTLFVCIVLFIIVLGMAETYAYIKLSGDRYRFNSFTSLITYCLMSSVENSGILLGIFLGKKFYNVQVDLEKKEKEKKGNELRLLKSQLDPHFLFNNLNTVDSLIDSNPDLAKRYINRLSKLYRYLIQTKDDEVIALEDELNFAKDYIFLLEQRFGGAYKFEILLETNIENKLIPPGALQTLIENVVKHNKGDSEEPIVMILRIQENSILIRNNIKKKMNSSDSNGTGIENLRARYRFLTDDEIVIDEGEYFEVSLPIIKNID